MSPAGSRSGAIQIQHKPVCVRKGFRFFGNLNADIQQEAVQLLLIFRMRPHQFVIPQNNAFRFKVKALPRLGIFVDDALNPSLKIGTHRNNLPTVPQYGCRRLQHPLGRLIGTVAPHRFFNISFDTLYLFLNHCQRRNILQRTVLIDKREHGLLGLRQRRYRFDERICSALGLFPFYRPILELADLQCQKSRRIEFLYGKTDAVGMELLYHGIKRRDGFNWKRLIRLQKTEDIPSQLLRSCNLRRILHRLFLHAAFTRLFRFTITCDNLRNAEKF